MYRSILNTTPLDELPAVSRIGQVNGEELDRALSGQAGDRWYRHPLDDELKLLRTATPIIHRGKVIGAVMAQQNSNRYLSLTDQAFSRLLLYSLGAIFLSTFGLLAYASWLSWRIRRLSMAAASAIGEDGSINNSFPASKHQDELGQLSRQYADMLERLREYTDYLRGLSRKLSHELRTPIAVIQSSLDNLDQAPENAETYLARSREGLARLSHILTAMSEATRLEESIQSTHLENLDLVRFGADIVSAYSSVYPDHSLRFSSEAEQLCIQAAPELLAQLLDKLFDNAASFAPAQSSIELELQQAEGVIQLTVSNDGPLLPDTMQGQLFDSMVSVRDSETEGHLGLGLHIARLIAEFHGAQLSAHNREDNSGVIFCLSFSPSA